MQIGPEDKNKILNPNNIHNLSDRILLYSKALNNRNSASSSKFQIQRYSKIHSNRLTFFCKYLNDLFNEIMSILHNPVFAILDYANTSKQNFVFSFFSDRNVIVWTIEFCLNPLYMSI